MKPNKHKKIDTAYFFNDNVDFGKPKHTSWEDRIEERINHSWHDKKLYAQNENTGEFIDVTDIVEEDRQQALSSQKKQIIKHLEERIAYIKKYRLGSDYTNGYSGIESGPCCSKCRMNKKEVIKSGRAVPLRLLIGCTDPFQIKCKCHIPYRKVAVAAELELLKQLKWYLEVRPDYH